MYVSFENWNALLRQIWRGRKKKVVELIRVVYRASWASSLVSQL